MHPSRKTKHVEEYARSVFLNCPFDDAYLPLFHALIFAICDSGYIARSALEIEDSSEVRIEKIARIIETCRLGIHDLSRTELDAESRLPRLNMALELGMFLGAKRFGGARQQRKNCLILDRERYRYQRFISDIAGQDISAHGDSPMRTILAVRTWLGNDAAPFELFAAGGMKMAWRYETFREMLPRICARLHMSESELTFNDLKRIIARWQPGSGARS
ncbi:MAG: hypothetical protein JOZ54_15075 [Acidobacteria bacterium]|nr:hypothetical protein [Acidobacteriota bacterium]